MAIPNCDTGPQPSRIPGNIGTLKSKVMIWDHDPFWARPLQILSWPFSESTERQMQETVPDVVFEMGAAFLRPTFKHHDMFVCTKNPKKGTDSVAVEEAGPPSPESNSGDPQVDFVGSPESGLGHIAQSRMPGGKIYNCNGGDNPDQTSDGPCAVVVNGETIPAEDPSTGKDIFPHQVWEHKGNLFSNRVIIHPSEYQIPLSDLQAAAAPAIPLANTLTMPQLQSAAKWDYIEVADNGKLSIWPIMITKQSPDLGNSVHWTIEKWTPTWQGQDFFVTIKFGDKRTDDTKDPNAGPGPILTAPYDPYLKYNLEKQLGPLAAGPSDDIPGITNQAFYVPPQKAIPGSGKSQQDLDSEALRSARAQYDWRYKTYILIEIGVHDPNHNYFIELRKGSEPRFLHLGEEWDSASRLEQGVNANPNSPTASFNWHKKCRVISQYNGVKTDQLFRQKDFRFTVRNHLGRIVVTFEGYESNPWVIRRLDNDPTKTNFSKVIVPMVTPSGKIRIHGGNISCAVNYTPTEYMPFSTITYVNRQIDTGPDNEDTKAKNKDIYVTFSHMGNSVKFDNPIVRETYFNDDRFLYEKVGYDCDAYLVNEKIKNVNETIPIYEKYDKQFRTIGKGWYNRTPRTGKGWEVERDPDTQLPLPPTHINGMNQGNGEGSVLSIVNSRDPSLEFPLSLTEPISGHYEWKDYIAQWDVGIELRAGSVELSPPSGENSLPVDDNPGNKVFENYVTPIATSWRLIVLGGGKPFEGAVTPFDIAPLVSHISDSWSHEDFHSLNHEMEIQCYIPIESTTVSNPRDENDPNLINIFNLGRKLLPLHDKSFYITVSYWWDVGIGHRYVESNLLNIAGENPNTNDILIQMTGVAYGATLNRSNNLLTMTFSVKDYMSVLENQMIFNSPFFDAVQDVQAVYELAKLAGFADESTAARGVDRRPLGYLRKVMNDGNLITEQQFNYNGEKSRSERYDLPGTYASLAEPSVKFQNGESYESAVKRIAVLGGKTVYFDRWGVLRLETPASLTAAFASANEDLEFTPVFDFVSTPIVRSSNIPDAGVGGTQDFIFDPTEHAAHLVYNALSYQRSVEDCVNQIIVMSASNDIRAADGSRTGGFVIEGYTFFDQMWKPESEGFIGYRKPLYQSEGAFGSVQGVRNAIGIYAKAKFPPVIMSFETYGVPGLKALDIITLDGNLGYITEIAHDIDPATNRWWMNITAEWLKPFKGELGLLETIEPDTGGDG